MSLRFMMSAIVSEVTENWVLEMLSGKTLPDKVSNVMHKSLDKCQARDYVRESGEGMQDYFLS